MKRIFLLAVAVLVLLPASASAVTDGELDGNRHPYVGLMVAQDAAGTPLWRCSGTLISPTLFLTAGHCTEAPAAHVEIWFDADVESRHPRQRLPAERATSAARRYTHPQYDPNAFFLYDLGVVVLDAPVERCSTYGALPSLEPARQAEAARQAGLTFTAVGYGLQKSFPDADT